MWIEFVVGSCLTPRVFFSMYSVPSQVICGLSLLLVLASLQGFFSMYSVPSQVICELSLVLVLASLQGFFSMYSVPSQVICES